MKTFTVIKRGTRDTGAGATMLLWECAPSDPPPEFRRAPARTVFVITIAETAERPPHIFRATRMTIVDRGAGKIGLQLAVAPDEVPDDIAYAPNGASFDIAIAPSPENKAGALPVSPEDRMKTLRRLVVMTRDPGFCDFLRTYPDGALIDECERADPKDVEYAAIEVVLREIGAHTRADILHDALIADRAEHLLRAYRETVFKRKKAA
jgi:diadenosine tetraphosphatase ApaH/serine/threonine PP2A family protein phosphatase